MGNNLNLVKCFLYWSNYFLYSIPRSRGNTILVLAWIRLISTIGQQIQNIQFLTVNLEPYVIIRYTLLMNLLHFFMLYSHTLNYSVKKNSLLGIFTLGIFVILVIIITFKFESWSITCLPDKVDNILLPTIHIIKKKKTLL